MSTEAIILWVLGNSSGLAGAGIVAYIKMTERVTKLETLVHADLADRVTKMETLLNLMGEKAAKLLHSDDDPYGIDSLLDKYLDRHYELTFDEWKTLLEKCSDIENNKRLGKGERLLASWMTAVASHKLRMPPPIRKNKL